MTKGARGLRSTARRVVAEPGSARRYLAPDLNLEQLFARPRQNDVCCVGLRRFDSLPRVDAGVDTDTVRGTHLSKGVMTLRTMSPRRVGRF